MIQRVNLREIWHWYFRFSGEFVESDRHSGMRSTGRKCRARAIKRNRRLTEVKDFEIPPSVWKEFRHFFTISTRYSVLQISCYLFIYYIIFYIIYCKASRDIGWSVHLQFRFATIHSFPKVFLHYTSFNEDDWQGTAIEIFFKIFCIRTSDFFLSIVCVKLSKWSVDEERFWLFYSPLSRMLFFYLTECMEFF